MLTAEQLATQTTTLELSRAAFITLLNRAKHVAPTRSPKAILTCVLLEASEGFLRVKATDCELSLYMQMPVEGSLPACAVPLAELTRRLKASKHPACSLRLAPDGRQLSINGGRVEHTIQCLDPAEFPVVPSELNADSIEIDAAELIHAIKVISPAVAKEPSRYAINGILFESNEQGLRLVATDGRRLAMVDQRNCGDLNDQALIPHRFCGLIGKLTDTYTDFLAFAIHREKTEQGAPLAGHIFAAGPNWVLSTYECNGGFPNYRVVTPRSHSRFAVDRSQVAEVLSEVALATNDESRMVLLDLGPNELTLSAHAPGTGNAVAKLPTKFLGGGDAIIHTAFNPAYLLDVFKTLESSTAVIDIAQNGYGCNQEVFGKPALIYDRHNARARWVLMPVNAGLEATRENLGSNYPEHLDEEQETASETGAT